MYLNANKALKNILLSCVLFSSFVAFGQQSHGDNTIVSEVRNNVDNTPTSISFSASAAWRQDQAQQILSRYLQYTTGGDIDMRFRNTVTTKTNITTQRFDEFYKGVKVAYGGFTLTGKDGLVGFMTGNFYKPAGNPSSIPAITEAKAFTNALSFVGAEKYRWQDPHSELFIKKRYHNNDTTYLPKGQLVWVEDMRSGLKDHKLHLAYSFDIYAEKPMSRQLVYIDAATGRVLFADQLIKHTAATGASRYSGVVPFQTANTLGTYYMFDSTRGDGVYTMNMENGTDYFAASDYTSATNTWPVAPADNVAIDAQWGAEVVYDYLFSQHGRMSWDGLDGILMQYVHYGVNYNNAFWNGSEMTYGDGTGLAAGGFTSLVSLDVTAHEIGHGICQATCGLIYESEPGALNEAFSDCWGATIEHWGDPHEVDAMPKNAWEMGEEISTEPLRSLNTPLLQGQPNTYGSTNWFNVVACVPSSGNDQCGVHRNSGLMNYWYYLLVNGGTGTNGIGNNYVVNAIGWTKAANILYASELALSSVAEYVDMRTASINAANILYGPCSPEAQSVTSAWYAVGVGPNFVPCVPQISFTTTSARTTEAATATTCTASHTFNVGLKPTGTVAGGNPVANILIAPTSTAVLGVDFTLSTTSVTFLAGDPSTKFFTVTVFDNGAVNDNKHIDFAFTVTPMGTGAVVAPFNDSMTLYIDNNDSIPRVGSTIFPNLNAGIPVVSDFSTAFYGNKRRAKSQFLLYANELAVAGVVPGVPISQIAFNILTKSSTAPFIGYTISMRNTTAVDLYSNFVTGLTQVYTGDYTTTLGMNAIDFNTGTFTWDGTSNVVVQLCFGMTPAAFSANDKVAGVQQGSFIIGGYETSNSGSGDGCTLGFNSSNRMVVRPVMRFKQIVPPSAIETTAASNRIYNVRSGQEVYFYSTADTQVIAGIKGMDFDLGCVTATVTQQGNGVVPASFSAINRSRKEVNIVPTINGGITTYDVTFYMTTAELAGISPSSLFILKTNAPTDATVSNANSVVLTPTLITAGNYTGFRATTTGLGRFMLVDGPLCNTPVAHITAGGPSTFCLGGNVVLSTPFGALLSYQWQKDGITIPGATNFNFTATLGGDYTVVVNQSVCDSVSLPFTVTVDSAFAAPITGAGSVCQGQTITLSDATPGGVWASGNVAVATVSATGVVTGVSGGTATISYSATNPCGTATSTFVVSVNALTPVAPITGTYSVCNTYTTALANATTPGVWSSGAAGIASVGPMGVVTGVSPGVAAISYAFTNGFGCVSYATANVSVNVTPAAMTSPTGAFAICTGVTATFNATPATPGHTFQWQNGGVDIAGATSSAYLTPTPGTYRVLVTNTSGCVGTSPNVILTISATATVTPTVTLSTSVGGFNICETTTPVTFTATPVFGGGAPTYQWSVNGTIVGGSGPTYAYVPVNGDIVACQLNSSYPCAFPTTATTSETMVVNPLVVPSVSVNPVPNDTVCTGGTVTYAALPVNGGTFPTYTWTENGILVASGPSYATAPHDGDIIICQMTSNAVCRSTSVVSSAPFVMSVQPYVVQSVAISMSPTVLVPGMPMTFVAVTTNAGPLPAYQWFVNSTAIAGATNITYVTSTLTNGQVVSCKVTSSLICAAPHTVLSGGLTVKTASGTGVTGVAENSALTLLPNPNKGVFTIAGTTGLATGESISISVVNMLGQEVYKKATEVTNGSLNEEIELPHNIAAGMYIVSVTSGQLRQVFHVSVEK